MREYNKLYCPHNLWKFNKRLVDEIKSKGRIVCKRVISMLDGPESDESVVPVKVQIEALYRPGSPEASPRDEPEDQEENLQYHGLMKDNIFVKMSAFGERGSARRLGFYSQEFSLLELQSTMYFFEGLSLVDPGTAPRQACSMPFFLVDSFKELCQYVLFHFVQIGGISQSESNSALHDSARYADAESESLPAGRRSAQSEELAVDFSEEPNGIFLEPFPMKFLMRQEESELAYANGEEAGAGGALDLDIDIEQVQLNQADQRQGSGQPSSQQLENNRRLDALLGDYVRRLPGRRGSNCTLNIFHVENQLYKMLITPTFDSQTMLFIRILKQHNNRLNASARDDTQQSAGHAQLAERKVRDLLDNLETLQKIQPRNVGSLQIDVEFKSKEVADAVFPKHDIEKMEFTDGSAAQ